MTFGKVDASLTRLNDTKTRYYAVTDDIKNIDKLLIPKAETELAVLPPAILAKRTIFIRQVDATVGGRTANDIRDKLIRLQHWLNITEVIKIKDYI